MLVRGKGARDIALIPASELSGLIETAHLLRSQRNARRKSIPAPSDAFSLLLERIPLRLPGCAGTAMNGPENHFQRTRFFALKPSQRYLKF